MVCELVAVSATSDGKDTRVIKPKFTGRDCIQDIEIARMRLDLWRQFDLSVIALQGTLFTLTEAGDGLGGR